MVESDLTAAEKQQSISISVLTLVLLISPLIIFLVRNATHTIQVTPPRVCVDIRQIAALVVCRCLPAV